MNRLCSTVFFAALLLDGSVALAETLTLEQLIVEARERNPELRALAADVAAAKGEATTARTWSNPELAAVPGVKHVRGEGSEFHGDLELTQTFEFPGKRTLRRAVAQKNVEARELALAGFRFQLTIQVRRAYYSILTAQQIVALKEQQLALANSFAEAAKRKVEGGFAPEFEATKAEVEVVTAQKAVREAQAQVGTARAGLNALLGRKPTGALEVAGELGDGVALPGEAMLLEEATARNPSLQVQAAEIERTGLNVRSARKSRLPDFTIGPSLEYTKDEQIYGLGVSLPLPLWDRKRGEIATATAEQQKALAEFDKLQQEILRDVASARQNLAATTEGLAYFTPALREKLKTALDAASQSYSEGRTTLLIYLETLRTYFDTQADYLETLQKLYDARAELESAVGVPLDELKEKP